MIRSKQRDLIYHALNLSCSHPTAEELYSAIHLEGENSLSLATVYRNLNQLVEAGMIARVSIPGEADRYDAVNDGHLHMLCKKCGTVEDVPKAAIPDICVPASDASGCDITSFSLLFSGLCPNCK